MDEIKENLESALSCVFTGTGGLTNTTQHQSDDCPVAAPVLWITLIVAAAQMHSQVLVSKNFSGARATLVLAVAPYVAYVVFPFLPAHAGRQYRDVPSYWVVIGGAVSLIGAVWFWVRDQRDMESYAKIEDSTFVKWFLKESFCGEAKTQKDLTKIAKKTYG